MKIVKGSLVVMNSECRRDIEGIVSVFIPTRNRAVALDYVRGNGDIIGLLPYEIDMDEVSDVERAYIVDRLLDLAN